VQTLGATHADCATWLAANAARLGFNFDAWRQQVRFTRVVKAIKENGYSDFALNVDFFYAAQAFGWPWVLIQGDLRPWLIVPAAGFALQVNNQVTAAGEIRWQTLALAEGRQPWFPALPSKVA
jgi:hypothetical protein